MSYTAAVEHLYARGHELAPALGPGSAAAPRRKFDLAHMRTLAAALGNPQNAFPAILIAGTNGKGSTAATLASILKAAGYRTGLYTSPHLERVNERIQIDGAPIADDDFARLYFQVDTAGEKLTAAGQLPQHPSFFETLTALAFLYFAGEQGTAPREDETAGTNTCHPERSGAAPESKDLQFLQDSRPAVDIAVLEVGMGGRLDATNIVEPLLSIITDISLDHQEYLGHTIAEIAREKAGILRPHGTLITLPQHPEANQAIGEAAATLELHAINAAGYIPHTPVPANQQVSESASHLIGPQRNRYSVILAGLPLLVDSPLTGRHQQRNIALAIAAAEELRNPKGYNLLKSNPKSYTITTTAIEQGIRNTQWPGRLELVHLPNSAPLLLDVAHNPAGAWTLRAALARLPEAQPRTIIFSCLRDKDLREMAQILLPLFDSSSPERPADHILLAPINSPRAASLEDLAAVARDLEIPAATATTPAEALAEARRITPRDGLIVATGSIYLVGELRALAMHAGATSA